MGPDNLMFAVPLPDTPVLNKALEELVVLCNGFVYPGPEIEAEIRVIKVLRTRPDLVKALLYGS